MHPITEIGVEGFLIATKWQVCIKISKQPIDFKTIDSAVAFLENMKIPMICYIHEAGHFAFHQFRDLIHDFTPIKIIKDKIAAFKINNIEFRDSSLILPIDIEKYNKEKSPTCTALAKIIAKFESRVGRHLTISGAGRAEWRKIAKRKMPQSSALFYKIFRDWYHGGRTEVFQTGKLQGKWEIYDINSAYPSAMNSMHPIGTHPIATHDRAEILNALYQDNSLPFFVKINAEPKGAFPVVIWKSKHVKSLFFPCAGPPGDFYITSHELRAALDLKIYHIDEIQIKKAIVFDDYTTFQTYVKKWSDVKKNARTLGDQSIVIIAKLMLNSLYGGFAINPDNFRDYMVAPTDDQEGLHLEGWTAKTGGWGNHRCIYERIPDTINRHINVATSASITGQVRATMLRAIHNADTVVYCDTDSIFCRKPGNLKIGNDIGEWKLEAIADKLTIAAPKMYSARLSDGTTKTASKGVNLTGAEIERIAAGHSVNHTLKRQTQGVTGEAYYIKREIKGKKGR